MTLVLGAVVLGALVQAAGLGADAGRLVDLTHPFDGGTVYWPTARRFTLAPVARGVTAGGWWYAANDFCAAEHGGTHLDATIHFAEGGWTVDQVPLERLIGADADALLTREDLETLEARAGRIPDGAIVLVRSGWDVHWADSARYLGSPAPADPLRLHFPGVAEDAARWLVTERRVKSVGIDTASIDHGPSREFRAHRALASANVPVFENLAGLGRLPARGATFIGLPMKVGGGSGGPLRAVAVLPE
jgi:kynurenine formamidase